MEELESKYIRAWIVSILWWLCMAANVIATAWFAFKPNLLMTLFWLLLLTLSVAVYVLIIAKYRDFLESCMGDFSYQVDWWMNETVNVSRIKLSFDSWLSMYKANPDPWTLAKGNPPVHEIKEPDLKRFGPVEHYVYRTVVFFSLNDYFRYKRWLKNKHHAEEESERTRKEAKARQQELDLNMKFLDSVTADVARMKSSAEAEILRAADELKKAAQPK